MLHILREIFHFFRVPINKKIGMTLFAFEEEAKPTMDFVLIPPQVAIIGF
jgi:hypothetical protein